MVIKIEEGLGSKLGIDLKSLLSRLLQKVPQQDVRGLGSIELVHAPPAEYKNERKVKGFYSAKGAGKPIARIFILPVNIYGHWPFRLYRFVPFAPALLLAATLYHEIAHHCQTLQHGIDKNRAQKEADAYARSLIRSRFKRELRFLGLFFWPCLLWRRMMIGLGRWYSKNGYGFLRDSDP